MLNLTRHKNESIIIQNKNETIEIVVKEINSKTVRLGINADDKFKIIRSELLSINTETSNKINDKK